MFKPIDLVGESTRNPSWVDLRFDSTSANARVRFTLSCTPANAPTGGCSCLVSSTYSPISHTNCPAQPTTGLVLMNTSRCPGLVGVPSSHPHWPAPSPSFCVCWCVLWSSLACPTFHLSLLHAHGYCGFTQHQPMHMLAHAATSHSSPFKALSVFLSNLSPDSLPWIICSPPPAKGLRRHVPAWHSLPSPHTLKKNMN